MNWTKATAWKDIFPQKEKNTGESFSFLRRRKERLNMAFSSQEINQ